MAPQRTTRRTALQICGLGLVGVVAGCSSDEGTPATTRTETATSTRSTVGTSDDQTTTPASQATASMGESVSAGGTTVTVSEPQVRKIIYTPDAPPSHHVYPAGDTQSQFLTVAVETDGTDPTDLSLRPVLDDTPRSLGVYKISGDSGQRDRIGFQVPVESIARGVIEWQTPSGQRHRWALPDSEVAALGASPQFAVEAFDVPGELERDERFSATVTVRNTGERDGRFLGHVIDEGASSVPFAGPFEVPVATGETVTREITGTEVRRDPGETTAILDWGLGTSSESLTVV